MDGLFTIIIIAIIALIVDIIAVTSGFGKSISTPAMHANIAV